MISKQIGRGLGAVAAGCFAVGITAGAMAHENHWQESHPRRVEVNHRLDNLNARISHERKDGQITKAEAVTLHRDAHDIRKEERGMAATDHGHITATEQHELNQQENALGAHLGR